MRVLAINDISCVGKCSLTVALPVLSACGVTCDILPTALLSTHTGGFTGYTFLGLDDEMQKICDHWETLGQALSLTADFCYRSIVRTQKEVPDRRYGLNYEREILPFLEQLEKYAR